MANWTREKIAQKVSGVIAETLGLDEDEVALDSSFEDDLNADSLDVVEIVMSFEEEFRIEIPDDDTEKLTHVRTVVDYLEGRLVR